MIGQAIGETLFDILYLGSVITFGILMLKKSKAWDQYRLFGLMFRKASISAQQASLTGRPTRAVSSL